MFEDLFTKLKRFYGNIYTKYAIFVSKNYLLFICIPFFINLILSFGILKVNFIKDPNDLFTLEQRQNGAVILHVLVAIYTSFLNLFCLD